MYYAIYKIVNQIDGKFYIGSHKTKDLNDNYMGSGKYLKRAIEKYGLDKFTKEILFVYDNPEQMYAKEAEIVNEDFLVTENTYNLKVGGFGGWDYINKNFTSAARSEHGRIGGFRRQENIRNNPEMLESFKKQRGVHFRNLRANGLIPTTCSFTGKSHTAESKNKIGSKNKINSLGTNNWNFGKMWITNGVHSMKIDKKMKVPIGYRIGRVM